MASEKVYKFTDPAKPAKNLIVMLKIEIFFAVLGIFGILNSTRVLIGIKNDDFSSEEEMLAVAERSDMIVLILGLTQVLLAIIILIIFLRWMYRAAANNFAWGIENISQKPHWGWINYIIPFWFLFKPYQFLREIWNAVEFDKSNPAAWKNLPGPKCLKVYWICFIVGRVLDKTIRTMQKGKDLPIEKLIALNNLSVLSSIIEITLGVALIMLVSGIMARQLQYCRKLAGQNCETELLQ